MIKNVIIFSFLLILCSCTEEWKQQYEEGRGPLVVVDQSVYEYLQTREEYSEFVNILKKNKADSLLQNGQRYTIWAPKNGSFPTEITSLNDSIQGIAMYNHITAMEFSEASFKDNLTLKAFSEKTLWMHETADGFTINGNKINKTLVVCKDGVIYDIDGFLEMRPNLFEGFWDDPKYKVMQDVLEEYMDSVFIKDLSTEIGEDFEGRPIYDSVFEPRVSVFNHAAIDIDDSYYSVFLTPNEELKEEIDTYFKNVEIVTGFEADKEDSTKLYDWLVYSFIHSGLIEEDEYLKEERRYSQIGYLWRTSYQQIIPTSKQEYSNGYLYEMEDLFIPYSLINVKETSSSLVTVYDFQPDLISVDIQEEYQDQVELVHELQTPSGSSAEYLFAKATLPPTENAPVFDFSISWETAVIDVDSTGKLFYEEIAMIPGEYAVYITFVKTIDANQDFAIYINDEYVNTVKMEDVLRINEAVTIRLGRVEIAQNKGVAPIKVTMKNLATSWKRALAPMSVRLERTVNNY